MHILSQSYARLAMPEGARQEPIHIHGILQSVTRCTEREATPAAPPARGRRREPRAGPGPRPRRAPRSPCRRRWGPSAAAPPAAPHPPRSAFSTNVEKVVESAQCCAPTVLMFTNCHTLSICPSGQAYSPGSARESELPCRRTSRRQRVPIPGQGAAPDTWWQTGAMRRAIWRQAGSSTPTPSSVAGSCHAPWTACPNPIPSNCNPGAAPSGALASAAEGLDDALAAAGAERPPADPLLSSGCCASALLR